MESNQEQLDEIKKLMNENSDGTILIGMVHPHLYGPLLGLNFKLSNPKPLEVHNYMTKGKCDPINVEVWKQTSLAARLMVLPNDILPMMKTPPITFNTIDEGVAHIRKVLASAPKDPWHFRRGLI